MKDQGNVSPGAGKPEARSRSRKGIAVAAAPWLLSFAGAVAAQAPALPQELLGTWASRRADCVRPGPTTLTISPSTVLRHDVPGHIISGWVRSERTIQVQFDARSSGAHALRFRTFRLSVSGDELYENNGDSRVMTRTRCSSEPKAG